MDADVVVDVLAAAAAAEVVDKLASCEEIVGTTVYLKLPCDTSVLEVNVEEDFVVASNGLKVEGVEGFNAILSSSSIPAGEVFALMTTLSATSPESLELFAS